MTLSKILGEKAAKYGVKCCTISLRLDVWARNVTGVLPCFSERNTAHVRWCAAQVIVAILGNLLCQMLTLLSLFAYGLVFGIEPMHNTQVITRWVSWTYRSYGHSECLGLQLCYHWLVWLPCYLWKVDTHLYFAISEYPVIGACCPLVLRASLALPAPWISFQQETLPWVQIFIEKPCSVSPERFRTAEHTAAKLFAQINKEADVKGSRQNYTTPPVWMEFG